MRAEPRATYRVQLRREFGFDDARAVVEYLAALGISHLYCSPYMQAAAGSAHGYDVVDPTRVSDDLGGDAGLQRLDAELRRHGMGQLLDIVPNHMSIADARNRHWWDVLQNGAASAHARFFDIDWHAPGLEGKVLLPVLGDELDAVLERAELTVEAAAGGLELRYFEARYPLAGSLAEPGVATRAALDEQHYVLEFWRSGLRRVNYRRFFDVATLAALRAEDEAVFEATHQRALQLVRAGIVDGLRVDHVDGLRDPAAYTGRLSAEAQAAWVVLEKILAIGEQLPEAWPVDGTTGYDFCALLGQIFVDGAGEEALTRLYRELTGDARTFEEHSRESRRQVLVQLLSAELDRLARVAAAAGVPDATAELAALVAGMPVYRVYPQGWTPLGAAGRAAVDSAAADAREHRGCDQAKLDKIVEILHAEGRDTQAGRELRARFQQLSSAAVAKGVEDTAFYRYLRLAALNDVGGDPGLHGIEQERFHEACARAAVRLPRTLNATATHDTKRGEDARIRAAMLSEMPEAWAAAVSRLRELAARHRGSIAPSPAAEYLLYQTLVAAHPLDADRAAAYMQKAAREAKQETSWLDQNQQYESELDTFVRNVAADAGMLGVVAGLVERMTPAWQTASLSQALLKLVAPGVPDIYQGCELWDLRLVDPDNRTPVDYGVRTQLLRALDGMSVAAIMAAADQGAPKLHLIRSALALRRRSHAAFAAGSAYARLVARGHAAEHVVACARGSAGRVEVVALAVRLPLRLGGAWNGTTIDLPPGEWRNALDGGMVQGGTQEVAGALAAFPVALLERIA